MNENFLKMFKLDHRSGCWNWTGNEHGTITIAGNKYLAHRYSYMVYFGSVPEDWHIIRVCGNFNCVNPEHLDCPLATAAQQQAIEQARLNYLGR